jgi:hypothetical protein
VRHIIAHSIAGGLLYTWLQDFRYGWRMFRKNVLSSVVILASLAIGIGANTAIFSVVNTLLLRRLPYPHAERLAAVWLHFPALAQSRAHTLAGREQADLIAGVRTQSSLLEMLGAKPVLGRLLLPEDDKPGNPNVVILTGRIWKRLFNSDPAIVGKDITLDGKPFTVAGVIQSGFLLNAEVMPSEEPMDKVDLFLPLALATEC